MDSERKMTWCRLREEEKAVEIVEASVHEMQNHLQKISLGTVPAQNPGEV